MKLCNHDDIMIISYAIIFDDSFGGIVRNYVCKMYNAH